MHPHMTTDALGRRSRNHSVPLDERTDLNARDDRLMYYTRLFGPAPQPLQFHIWRDKQHVNYHNFQARMTKLVHGSKNQPPLFVRPDQLNPKYGAKCFPSWNDISEAGLKSLKDRLKDDAPKKVPPKRDPLHHRGMGACIDISLLTLAPSFGVEYLDTEYIFSHERCSDEIRRAPNPLLIDLGSEGKYEPDRLFCLRYPEGAVSFIREDCRGTETLETLKGKIERIKRLLRDRKFRQWGVPKPFAMFALTLPGRMAHLLDYLRGDPMADRFLFKTFPQFGTNWKAPTEPLKEVFEPWETAVGLKDISKP